MGCSLSFLNCFRRRKNEEKLVFKRRITEDVFQYIDEPSTASTALLSGTSSARDFYDNIHRQETMRLFGMAPHPWYCPPSSPPEQQQLHKRVVTASAKPQDYFPPRAVEKSTKYHIIIHDDDDSDSD